MPQDRRSIYRTAREARGLTQEAAAEGLGISGSSIRAYKTGQRIPPPGVVGLMVIAYNSQLLDIQHLRASAGVTRDIVPDVQEVQLSEAIMELLDRVYDFVGIHRDRELLCIGKDSVIDDQGRPIFDTVVTEPGDLTETAMAVRCAKQGYLEEGIE